MNSFEKLEYIHQHFQDNKKIYESYPDAARYETDNTLYPHINNNIEYGLNITNGVQNADTILEDK